MQLLYQFLIIDLKPMQIIRELFRAVSFDPWSGGTQLSRSYSTGLAAYESVAGSLAFRDGALVGARIGKREEGTGPKNILNTHYFGDFKGTNEIFER